MPARLARLSDALIGLLLVIDRHRADSRRMTGGATLVIR
jgi:hypothetical protein